MANAYVVLLHELLDAGKSIRRRVSGNDDRDPGSLAVLKLAADVRILVFIEIDCSGGVELNAGGMVVVERFRLLRRIHGQMIFDVLGIQREHVELLHEADQLRAVEIAKGVAGQAQTDRRGCLTGVPPPARCAEVAQAAAASAPERTKLRRDRIISIEWFI